MFSSNNLSSTIPNNNTNTGFALYPFVDPTALNAPPASASIPPVSTFNGYVLDSYAPDLYYGTTPPTLSQGLPLQASPYTSYDYNSSPMMTFTDGGAAYYNNPSIGASSSLYNDTIANAYNMQYPSTNSMRSGDIFSGQLSINYNDNLANYYNNLTTNQPRNNVYDPFFIDYRPRYPVAPAPSFNMMPPSGQNLNYSFFNPGISLIDKADTVTNPSILSGGSDIMFNNGIIHNINRVLLPIPVPASTTPPAATSSLATLLGDKNSGYDTNANDYDILRTLLVEAGLLETVNTAKDITVFAPIDSAFYQLAQDLGIKTTGYNEQQIVTELTKALTTLGKGNPIPVLQDILKYHVSGSRLPVRNLLQQTSIPTLQGGNIGVSVFR